MADDYQRLKDILRSNVKAVKDVADNLFYVRDKLEATQETVEELLQRVEGLEAKKTSTQIGGVAAFNAGSSLGSSAASHQIQALDLEPEQLPDLISQHPTWLRPFTVEAELEKHELEEDFFRLARSKAGYLRVIRLTDGSEWAYFETMSGERFLRLPLLAQVFINSSPDVTNFMQVWTDKPVRLQTLQRGSRWEVYEYGQYSCEIG